MYENEITGKIIQAAIEVHRILGPGLLESAYHDCLKHELKLMDLEFESEVSVPVNYKGLNVGEAYRMDLLVANKVIVELKSVAKITDIHRVQLLTYLKLTNRNLGLLINFNEILLKNGVKRVVNQF
jgi:GxxExxY protein